MLNTCTHTSICQIHPYTDHIGRSTDYCYIITIEYPRKCYSDRYGASFVPVSMQTFSKLCYKFKPKKKKIRQQRQFKLVARSNCSLGFRFCRYSILLWLDRRHSHCIEITLRLTMVNVYFFSKKNVQRFETTNRSKMRKRLYVLFLFFFEIFSRMLVNRPNRCTIRMVSVRKIAEKKRTHFKFNKRNRFRFQVKLIQFV